MNFKESYNNIKYGLKGFAATLALMTLSNVAIGQTKLTPADALKPKADTTNHTINIGKDSINNTQKTENIQKIDTTKKKDEDKQQGVRLIKPAYEIRYGSEIDLNKDTLDMGQDSIPYEYQNSDFKFHVFLNKKQFYDEFKSDKMNLSPKDSILLNAKLNYLDLNDTQVLNDPIATKKDSTLARDVATFLANDYKKDPQSKIVKLGETSGMINLEESKKLSSDVGQDGHEKKYVLALKCIDGAIFEDAHGKIQTVGQLNVPYLLAIYGAGRIPESDMPKTEQKVESKKPNHKNGFYLGGGAAYDLKFNTPQVNLIMGVKGSHIDGMLIGKAGYWHDKKVNDFQGGNGGGYTLETILTDKIELGLDGAVGFPIRDVEPFVGAGAYELIFYNSGSVEEMVKNGQGYKRQAIFETPKTTDRPKDHVEALVGIKYRPHNSNIEFVGHVSVDVASKMLKDAGISIVGYFGRGKN